MRRGISVYWSVFQEKRGIDSKQPFLHKLNRTTLEELKSSNCPLITYPTFPKDLNLYVVFPFFAREETECRAIMMF